MPPLAGNTAPVTLVPAPRATTGILWAAAILTMPTTSSVVLSKNNYIRNTLMNRHVPGKTDTVYRSGMNISFTNHLFSILRYTP